MSDRIISRVCEDGVGMIEIFYEENFYENPMQDWDHDVIVVMDPKLDAFCTDPKDTTDNYSIEEIRKMQKWNDEGGYFALIRAYEHGEIMFSLDPDVYPFNDQWDSFTAGFMCIDPASVHKTWPRETDNAALHARCEQMCQGMIKLMNAYAAGECLAYIIYGPDMVTIEDSCGGYWNTYDRNDEFLKDMLRDIPDQYAPLKERVALFHIEDYD